MSSFRDLGDNDLADFTINLVNLLGGTDLPAIDSHVRADLVTAIGTLPADLATQKAAAVVQDDEKKTAFVTKDTTRSAILTWIGQVRDALKSGIANREQFTLAGFDYPFTVRSPYVAQDPTKLSASGVSNGVNTVVYQGNNRSGSVTYEIWRRQGDDGAWVLHGTTTTQKFVDKGVTPGQYYEYRVRAVASKSTSNFSNSSVVYGVL
jgi:hypothetical protein